MKNLLPFCDESALEEGTNLPTKESIPKGVRSFGAHSERVRRDNKKWSRRGRRQGQKRVHLYDEKTRFGSYGKLSN